LDYESEWLGLLDADSSIRRGVLRLLSYLEQDDAPTPFSHCKILGRTVAFLASAFLRPDICDVGFSRN
jgi:hypothetical protein